MRAGDRVCVAVSGGADSVALLRLLLELRAELGIVLAVAHFNHGLRGADSDADEAFVAHLADEHELQFFAAHGAVRDHAFTSKLSIEAAGRELRYRWLTQLAIEQRIASVATAHTLDDQAETVLLKFLRGAGTRGLAGIYPSREIENSRPFRSGAGDVDSQDPILEIGKTAPPTIVSVANREGPSREIGETPPLGSVVGNVDRENPSAETGKAAPPTIVSVADREGSSRAAAAGVEPGAQAPGRLPSQNEPRSGDQFRIVRPLLGVTRAEVESYLASLGQEWREDESNLDHRFARNRIRHELLPLLQREYNPNIRQVLRDTAELSREEEEFWQALVERELNARTSGAKAPSKTDGLDGTAKAVPFHPSAPQGLLSLANLPALPLALQRRLLRRFAETEGLALDFDHVERLLRCAHGEPPKTELPGGWLAVRRGDCLELRAPAPEPACPGYEYALPIPGEVRIAEIGLTMRAVIVAEASAREGDTGSLLSADLLGAELTVRNWLPGDRFHPAHRGSEEKLKRLFAEKHIPAEQRSRWPVALQGNEIVWVRGFPVARSHAWAGTGDAVRIEVA